MPSEVLKELVRLSATANPFQAHILQQALQQEGIQCQVLGDYLDAGIGDIPGMSAEVWVEAADFERAQKIVHQHETNSDKSDQPEKAL